MDSCLGCVFVLGFCGIGFGIGYAVGYLIGGVTVGLPVGVVCGLVAFCVLKVKFPKDDTMGIE